MTFLHRPSDAIGMLKSAGNQCHSGFWFLYMYVALCQLSKLLWSTYHIKECGIRQLCYIGSLWYLVYFIVAVATWFKQSSPRLLRPLLPQPNTDFRSHPLRPAGKQLSPKLLRPLAKPSSGLTRLAVSPVFQSHPSSGLTHLPVSPVFRSHQSSGLARLAVLPVLRSRPSSGLARLAVLPVFQFLHAADHRRWSCTHVWCATMLTFCNPHTAMLSLYLHDRR